MDSAASSARMSSLALATFALSTLPMRLGTMSAASRPMMMTTTMISMRVKPRARRAPGRLLPSQAMSFMRCAAGRWWRLLTAHVVHLDIRHALLNSLGLAVLWALFARDYSPRQWVAVGLGAMAAIDAGLWLCDSTLLWYVGSSGALHGVMAAGALAHVRRGQRDGWVLAGLLAVKLAYEHWLGALPFSGLDTVVVSAHLYGAIGGAAVAAFLRPHKAPL